MLGNAVLFVKPLDGFEQPVAQCGAVFGIGRDQFDEQFEDEAMGKRSSSESVGFSHSRILAIGGVESIRAPRTVT
jgi:hypothetical protein